MPIAPDAQRFLDLLNAQPSVETLDPPAARAAIRKRLATRAVDIPVPLVDQFVVDGRNARVPVRRYDPVPGTVTALVMYFHGGGWVICDLETHDTVCRSLATGTGATVLSVDYRRAPEDPFPAGLEDCYAATAWAVAHADALEIDPDRVAVAGDSSGGNLAAATTMLARDRHGPVLAYQVLVYPVTNHDFETASYREFATGYNLTRAAMQWYWDQYLSGGASGRDPLASPLRADLAGLPPALVVTAECDPLRDEGEAYAHRLEEAGVTVRLRRGAGLFHGSFSIFETIAAVDEIRRDVITSLRTALEPPSG